MEIKQLLGNFEFKQQAWFNLFEDSEFALKLISPEGWLPKLEKALEVNGTPFQYAEESKPTIVSGRRRIKMNANKKEESKKEDTFDVDEASLFKNFDKDVDFLLDHIIVDWKGLTENGISIPYSKEYAKKHLFKKDNAGRRFATTIFSFALNIDNFSYSNHQEDEEIIKK